MWAITVKELRQFFSSLTGYITLIIFLVVNALYLFVLKDSNIFDLGYATLEPFFSLAPWVFLFLIPAVSMRAFADEYKTGTIELLKTLPLTNWQIVIGKYLAIVFIIAIAILLTVIYPVCIHLLSGQTGIDTGGILGSYIGLFFLGAVFAAIGIWCSALTPNGVISFLLSALVCLVLYFGFHAIGKLASLSGGLDFYVDMLGIDLHYQSISRGVIDSRDIVYFLSLIFLFLYAAKRQVQNSVSK